MNRSKLSFSYQSIPFLLKVLSTILLSILLFFFLPPQENGLGNIFGSVISVSLARELPGKIEWMPDNDITLDFDNTDQSIADHSNSTKTFNGRVAIGVILPLSGDYAEFGKSVLNGILLASGVFGPWSAELLPIDIIVKDSKGDPLATANAVEELSREDVVAIIGPLLSKTSVSGVLKAQELKIPIISLSQKDELPEFGDYVFRNSMTSIMQARTLVHDVFFNLGLKKFAILYPENLYGIRLKDAFIREVERLEGEIVILEPYEEQQTDFGEEIKKIFQITEDSESKDEDLKKTYKPIVEFDALFIPDYSDRVVLIIPQLVYYNVKDLQLLGSNGWNSPRLMDVESDYVEGAIFTDGFFINSKNPTIVSFKKDFEETFEILPGILEAQAFDATKMIISIIKEKSVVDRTSLKNYLYELKNYPGVTGNISVDQNGEAQKELFLLKADNGRIVQVKWEEHYFILSEEDYEQEYDYEEDEENVY